MVSLRRNGTGIKAGDHGHHEQDHDHDDGNLHDARRLRCEMTRRAVSMMVTTTPPPICPLPPRWTQPVSASPNECEIAQDRQHVIRPRVSVECDCEADTEAAFSVGGHDFNQIGLLTARLRSGRGLCTSKTARGNRTRNTFNSRTI